MLDSTKLKRLVLVSNGKKHSLATHFVVPGGRLCDAQGVISPAKVRQVYMLAGIIPPQSDSAEELLRSVEHNIALLNAYLEYSGILNIQAPKTKESVKRAPKQKKA